MENEYNARMTELHLLDATAQADLVRKGEVSPLELVDHAIARAEKLNPALNAIVTPAFEQARAAARGKLPDGPFRGVPFLVKDLIAQVGGLRKTDCCEALADHVAATDSELVARYRRAGLVMLGLTSASEFGLLPTAESRLFGRTKNPWDATRTTGGSSGGSAAMVAARVVPMAHANDAGGSIRIPASCCGLFGLKPTRMRNPLGPDFGTLWGGLIHEHVVTMSVRDSARLLDATSGPMAGDPYVAPSPERPFADELEREPGRLRIAYSTSSPTMQKVHPDVIAAFEDAVKLCASLGHEVEEKPLDFPVDALGAFVTLYGAGLPVTIAHWERVVGHPLDEAKLDPLTRKIREIGKRNDSSAALSAIALMETISRGVAAFLARHDVYLTPTLAEPPIPLGSLDASEENAFGAMLRAGEFAPFTIPANITGNPAMSVPLAWNAAGLPIGIHFLGRYADEATLFRLAAQLERARPWRDRLPSMAR